MFDDLIETARVDDEIRCRFVDEIKPAHVPRPGDIPAFEMSRVSGFRRFLQRSPVRLTSLRFAEKTLFAPISEASRALPDRRQFWRRWKAL